MNKKNKEEKIMILKVKIMLRDINFLDFKEMTKKK
jgi:hypothetical protein